MTFVEAPQTLEDLNAIPRLLPAPQMLNMVLGGKTPIVDAAAAGEIGFGIVLYANAALQAAIHGMRTTLRALKATGGSRRADGHLVRRAATVGRPGYVRRDGGGLRRRRADPRTGGFALQIRPSMNLSAAQAVPFECREPARIGQP